MKEIKREEGQPNPGKDDRLREIVHAVEELSDDEVLDQYNKIVHADGDNTTAILLAGEEASKETMILAARIQIVLNKYREEFGDSLRNESHRKKTRKAKFKK